MRSKCPWYSRVLRSVLELRFSSWLRLSLALAEARAERNYLANRAAAATVRVFDAERLSNELRATKKSDTLFILGSGASVQQLTTAQLENIGTHLSVGINNWGVHPFVPDIFALESMPHVGDGLDFERALKLLRRRDIVLARPHILVLRPRSTREFKALTSLPSRLESRVNFYGRISPATRILANLDRDLRQLLPMLLLRYPGVFVDSGASIVRMVSVALALGCSRVVFVGVDLHDTRYFWEDNPMFKFTSDHPRPKNNQPLIATESEGQPSHETLLVGPRPFSVLDMLRCMHNIQTALGLEMLVASPTSKLAEFLPIYEWH